MVIILRQELTWHCMPLNMVLLKLTDIFQIWKIGKSVKAPTDTCTLKPNISNTLIMCKEGFKCTDEISEGKSPIVGRSRWRREINLEKIWAFVNSHITIKLGKALCPSRINQFLRNKVIQFPRLSWAYNILMRMGYTNWKSTKALKYHHQINS